MTETEPVQISHFFKVPWVPSSNYEERKSGGVETKTRKKGGIYYMIERGEEESEGHKQVHCL